MKNTLLLPVIGLWFSSCIPAAIIDATVTGFNAPQRRVVEEAISFWEWTIGDPITVKVAFEMLDLGGGVGGRAIDLVQDSNGLPKEATIQINDLDGSLFGWFVDSTPESAEEYVAGATSSHFVGRAGDASSRGYDLLTTLHHELTHVFGFAIEYDRFRSKISLGEDGFLRSYNGTDVTAVIAPEYDGTHLSDFVYPFDLMSPFSRFGERMLPSDLDLAILADAFDYTLNVNNPQPIPEPDFSTALPFLLIFFAYFSERKFRVKRSPGKQHNKAIGYAVPIPIPARSVNRRKI